MASIIGILFFVVLLVSLEIVDQKAGGVAAGAVVSPTEYEDLVTQVRELGEQQRRLLVRVRETSEGFASLSGGEKALLADVNRMNAVLLRLYSEIRQDQEAISSLRMQTLVRKRECRDVRSRIQDYNREISDLKEKLAALNNEARVVYIVDNGSDAMTPWLVEVSEGKVRVALKGAASSSLRFTADHPADLKRQFLEWAGSQDSSRYYFVLLMKPSGAQMVNDLMLRLKTMGYELGVDCLPEHWLPF